MKLISCDSCAVVLDEDKLYFPKDIYRWDGEYETIDESKADYDYLTKSWVTFVHCPVCKEKIFKQ